MKALLTLFWASILSAFAADGDVRLSLGAPEFKEGGFLGGHFEFVATVKNHSRKTFWLRSLFPEGRLPYYHAAVRRSASDGWKQISTMGSGLGMNHFKLAPGGSLKFTAQVQGGNAGYEYRALILVYPDNDDTGPVEVDSKIIKLPENRR